MVRAGRLLKIRSACSAPAIRICAVKSRARGVNRDWITRRGRVGFDPMVTARRPGYPLALKKGHTLNQPKKTKP